MINTHHKNNNYLVQGEKKRGIKVAWPEQNLWLKKHKIAAACKKAGWISFPSDFVFCNSASQLSFHWTKVKRLWSPRCSTRSCNIPILKTNYFLEINVQIGTYVRISLYMGLPSQIQILLHGPFAWSNTEKVYPDPTDLKQLILFIKWYYVTRQAA